MKLNNITTKPLNQNKMTPKEKAKELFNKYFSEIHMPSDCEGCMQCIDRCGNMVAIAKKYSLIAIEQIIEHINELDDSEWYSSMKQYIHDVKQEIEKL